MESSDKAVAVQVTEKVSGGNVQRDNVKGHRDQSGSRGHQRAAVPEAGPALRCGC